MRSHIIARAILSAITAILISFTANADVIVRWQPTKEALSKQVLEQSNIVSDFTQLINENFIDTSARRLNDIKVTLADAPIPRINAEASELILPYGYFTHAIKSHAELVETREVALQRAIDTVEYTLYHLFGHLVASTNSSDSDNTAESVSSWLMIKGFANGGEQWFADAEAFGSASQLLDGSLQDYWHEHSLYKARQRTINCWILGSSPERYEELLKPVLEPEARKQRCIAEWNQLDSEMQSLLKDNIKTNSRLITQ